MSRPTSMPRLVLVALLATVTSLEALAHHPNITEDKAASPETVVPMLDPTISHSVDREIKLNTGQVLLAFEDLEWLDVGVPAIGRPRSLWPKGAVIGPGLLQFAGWKMIREFNEALKPLQDAPATGSNVLFREGFEDKNLKARCWYDGNGRVTLSEDAAAGRHAIQYHFLKGKLTPSDSSGVRHAIEPTEVVYLRFYLKMSPGWSWTGKPYGPHLLHFMTTENSKYHGPAASHLTLYIEPVNGKLRLAAQDIQNQDSPHGLTQGPLRGGYNGTFFDSQDVEFEDDRWHCVEAMFRLNTLDLAGDKPNPDGEVRGWVDGEPVIERTDVVFRSTDFPRMKFDQFMMIPYFHDGVPHDQTLWIDELAVGTQRLGPAGSKP